MKEIIGSRIQKLRREQSQTQAQMVEVLERVGIKITQATLSAYEQGKSLPPITLIDALGMCYGVSIDWLCGKTDYKGPVSSNDNYSDIINRIYDLFTVFPACKVDRCYNDPDNSSSYDDLKSLVSCIAFSDDIIQEYLERLEKMWDSFKSGSVDSEIMDLWHEKMLKKYNYKIPKTTKEAEELASLREIENLPF